MSKALTAQQISEMFHAIGGEYKANPYRNHFCTQGDNVEWNDLVDKGFASKRKDSMCASYVFHVTDEGMKFLKKIST